MKKHSSTYGWLALVMALALLLTPALALAAEETPATETPTVTEAPAEETLAEETPEATEDKTSEEIAAEDLSYAKYLLRNVAFYELNDKVLKAATIEDLMKNLVECDPWAQYYSAEVFGAQMEFFIGDFVGIGVYMRAEEDRVVIAGVIANSPAEKAGLKSGDYIVEVDGVDVRGASMEELQEALSGEENSLLVFKYERDGKVTQLTMNRKRIVDPSMEYWLLEENIGYVLIENFTTHTGEELAAGIKTLKKQGMTALIVDLRNCPGGELEGAVDTSGVLAGEGPMMFFMSKEGWQSFIPVDKVDKLGMPLAVLINGYTASSAELVAANVQDAGTGVLIGEVSFGKGVVQTVIPLPSGAGISFTTEKYVSHGYQDIDAQGGVLPDIYVSGEEAQRYKAVAWIKEQLQAPAFLKYYTGLNGYSRSGEWQNAPASAYLAGGSAYVPLNLTLVQLGWQLQERDGLLYAENDGQRMIVDAENNTLVTRGGNHSLIVQNGELHLPAALLRDYGYTVTWSGSERSIKIEK